MSEFRSGDRVLCFHDSNLYQAKILRTRIETQGNGTKLVYFVHYIGWKAKFDEWVDLEMLRPINPDEPLLPDAPQQDYHGEEETLCFDSSEVFTSNLAAALTKDRIRCKLKGTVYALPMTPTVNDCLMEARSANISRLSPDFLDLIGSLFDGLIFRQLLYKCERTQAAQTISKLRTRSASEIYGAIHLARLLVSIPAISQEYGQDDSRIASEMMDKVQILSNYITTIINL